MTEAALT